MHISTDHQVQFLNGLAIFHTPWHTQGVWKIAKNHNPLAKFCCGNVQKIKYFFHFFEEKNSNNSKKIKKKWKIIFFRYGYRLLPNLSSLFFKNCENSFLCPKTKVFWFLVQFQKVRGILVIVTLTVTVKNF